MATPAPLRDTKADAAKRKRERRSQHKDKDYLGFVAGFPCVACGCKTMVEVHHQPRKSQAGWHDRKTVPLCIEHHRGGTGVHLLGVENFQKQHGIDFEYEVERLNKLYEGVSK